MLFYIETQMPRHITVQQSACGDHLGVEQRTAREQAVKVTAMPVRPIHHRRDAKSVPLLSGAVDGGHGQGLSR
jgi:hypothetical protein